MFVLELTLCTPEDWCVSLRTKVTKATGPILTQRAGPAKETLPCGDCGPLGDLLANPRYVSHGHCLARADQLAPLCLEVQR